MRNSYFFYFFILLKFFIFGSVSLVQKDDLEDIDGSKKHEDLNITNKKIDKLKMLREKNSLYKEMHEKYITNTKKKFLKKCEILYVVNVVKEINFSEKYNETVIGELSLLIKISIFDIKEKMLIPYNPELGINKKKESFFDFNDVCLIEITSNYVKSTNYPNVICDNLIFTIKIPANNFIEGIERTVCCFKYSDVMDFLIKKEYKINVNGSEMLFVDAVEKHMFHFSYLFINGIDINEKYKIKENDFYQNNQIGSFLIQKYTENTK